MIKKYLPMISLILILVSIPLFSDKARSEECLFQHPIPSGWKFRAFEMTDSYIGIFFWPDIEFRWYEPQVFPKGRVQILDKKSGEIVFDIITEPGERFRLLKNNKIILVGGDESGDDSIRMLTIEGKELWRVKWPQGPQIVKGEVVFDLKAREFGYVDLMWGALSTPAIVYDLDTGREKFRFGPLTFPEKLKEAGAGLKVFLPIGEDNLFLMGIGASVFLKHYDDRKDVWAINNVGGNINSGGFLGDDYICLKYWRRDGKNKYIDGLVIIEWRTGKIVFRLENIEIKINGVWQKRLSIPIPYPRFIHIDEEDNSLIFTSDKNDNLVVRIPYDPKRKTWPEEKLKRYRAQVKFKMVGKSKEYQEIFYGKYVVDEIEEGGLRSLKIRKVSLKEED